jgi:hypothetical protein
MKLSLEATVPTSLESASATTTKAIVLRTKFFRLRREGVMLALSRLHTSEKEKRREVTLFADEGNGEELHRWKAVTAAPHTRSTTQQI